MAKHFAGQEPEDELQPVHNANGQDPELEMSGESMQSEQSPSYANGQDPESETPSANVKKVQPVRDPIGKRESKNNMTSNILIIVGVLLLIIAGVIFAINTMNYRKIDDENKRVAEYAKLTDDGEQPPVVDWAALKAMNPDVVGWLQIPGTIVNYPVFKSDDNDFYLHHAPDRSESIGGAVFMDYENTSPGMVDPQTIVYGHHMRNGSQFKPVADMDNQELFDGVKTVWYVTEGGAFKLAPLFLYYVNENDTEVRQFQFQSPDAFHAYLNKYLGEAKTRRPDVETAVNAVGHVLTLSTCNYYDGYGRTLLVCAPKSEIPGMPEYQPAPAPAAPSQNDAQPEGQGNEEGGGAETAEAATDAGDGSLE